jgi:hypothetical protein
MNRVNLTGIIVPNVSAIFQNTFIALEQLKSVSTPEIVTKGDLHQHCGFRGCTSLWL